MKTLKKSLISGLALIAVCSLLLIGCSSGTGIASDSSRPGFFRNGFQTYCRSLTYTEQVMLKDSGGYQAFLKSRVDGTYIAEK